MSFGQQDEWRRIGNSAIDLALAAPATGPIARVWFSGSALYAQTDLGLVFSTGDFETWKPANIAAPARLDASPGNGGPEPAAQFVSAGSPGRWYAFGRFVHRSDDGGQLWSNVTAYRNESILGGPARDMAVNPADADDVVVATAVGVWRSLDGGTTWTGLNQGLPNLPANRIAVAPSGLRSARLIRVMPDGSEFGLEWAPGEKYAWRLAASGQARLRNEIAARLGVLPVAAVRQRDFLYAGTASGQLMVSTSNGEAWVGFTVQDGGPVSEIYVDPGEPRIAFAVLATKLMKTVNGGVSWTDVTANLPNGPLRGIAADSASGSVYVAAAGGIFMTTTDFAASAPITWNRVPGQFPAPVADLALDEAANQLYALVDGYGLYGAMAPHRVRQLAVVNGADFSSRPAAPGALLSILGARLNRVRAGNLDVPVLGATDKETQIQMPFESTGQNVSLTYEAADRPPGTLGVPLAPVSPAIFIDKDGSALLIDADSGVPLDAGNPARSGSRVQILATGLGAVDPPWPTGRPAPAENIPKVVAPVRVYLDREPLPVTAATLAPGYIGFYLVELQLPAIVNSGPAELYLEVGNQQSNRVRLYLLP